MGRRLREMKIVKLSIELVLDDDPDFYLPGEKSGGTFTPLFDHSKISEYLNNKLYNDPEFFGDFGPENIVSVTDWE
jgi:hypothetical protein